MRGVIRGAAGESGCISGDVENVKKLKRETSNLVLRAQRIFETALIDKNLGIQANPP